MGHPAGQTTDGLHFLGLQQLGLEFFMFLLGQFSVSDVIVLFNTASGIQTGLNGLTPVLKPSPFPAFSGHHVAFKFFDVCVVVICRKHFCCKGFRIIKNIRNLFPDQLPLILSDDIISS